MPFQPGHQLSVGTHHLEFSRSVKEKVLKKAFSVWQSADPEGNFKKLAKEDYKEFMKIIIALLPKDTNLSGNLNHNLSPNQLQSCVEFVAANLLNQQNQQNGE